MPTPYSDMANLAATLGAADASSNESVEAFYTEEFPRYGENIRALIVDWLSSLDEEPTPQESERFYKVLKAQTNFGVQSTTNPFYENDEFDPNTPEQQERHFGM